MRFRNKFLVSAALLVSFTLVATGCSKSGSIAAADRLRVVTTAFPLFEAASSVGGDRVAASNLLPLDPFGPVDPKVRFALKSAPLAIVLGHGTQPAVDAVVAQRTGPTLSILDSFPDMKLPDGSGTDPYVWENPQNMAKVVAVVQAELVKLDSKGASTFSKNAKSYGKSIATVDRNYAATIATCNTKILVTEDPRYQYLAARYGLTQVWVDPTRGATDSVLRAAVNKYRPSTVFMADLPSLSEATRLQSTFRVKVSVLDPVVAQTDQARRGGSSYVDVMNLSLAALSAGLGCANTTSTGK